MSGSIDSWQPIFFEHFVNFLFDQLNIPGEIYYATRINIFRDRVRRGIFDPGDVKRLPVMTQETIFAIRDMTSFSAEFFPPPLDDPRDDNQSSAAERKTVQGKKESTTAGHADMRMKAQRDD